jgi:hypothetical protein
MKPYIKVRVPGAVDSITGKRNVTTQWTVSINRMAAFQPLTQVLWFKMLSALDMARLQTCVCRLTFFRLPCSEHLRRAEILRVIVRGLRCTMPIIVNFQSFMSVLI